MSGPTPRRRLDVVRPDACRWHPDRHDDLTLVGVVEGNSGPGWSVHACPGCVAERDLVPFEDHPPESWGELWRYRPDGSMARAGS